MGYEPLASPQKWRSGSRMHHDFQALSRWESGSIQDQNFYVTSKYHSACRRAFPLGSFISRGDLHRAILFAVLFASGNHNIQVFFKDFNKRICQFLYHKIPRWFHTNIHATFAQLPSKILSMLGRLFPLGNAST